MRLEREPEHNPYQPGLFQFHKGAIRTGVGVPCDSAGHIFQFHKGAIRTPDARQIERPRIISIP